MTTVKTKAGVGFLIQVLFAKHAQIAHMHSLEFLRFQHFHIFSFFLQDAQQLEMRTQVLISAKVLQVCSVRCRVAERVH